MRCGREYSAGSSTHNCPSCGSHKAQDSTRYLATLQSVPEYVIHKRPFSHRHESITITACIDHLQRLTWQLPRLWSTKPRPVLGYGSSHGQSCRNNTSVRKPWIDRRCKLADTTPEVTSFALSCQAVLVLARLALGHWIRPWTEAAKCSSGWGLGI